ncbi:DUF1007 domain-containing protein [Litorivita pollutaquae]|uniref:DUF1007 domain-containing protein n=1 Tax=Litorivita pollutaquae TaxID=2200892 RepID=A0A2V4MR50_9RHOB|nr:DUF1007 family protein [Litorivita pollutaquae]PYC49235.1 DUF1007 domain-containing protein [Litorivita pollutaquae]
MVLSLPFRLCPSVRRAVIPAVAVWLCSAVSPALAHPHIFVETGLRLEMDGAGHVVGIEVTWTYDELYSLLVLEDLELDDDYDGALRPDEIEKLSGFDLNWAAEFAGDLYLFPAAGADISPEDETGALALGAPENRGARFSEGKITTVHYRAVPAQAAEGLRLRAYDPTFYTAYEVSGRVDAPAPCRGLVNKPDLERAYAEVERRLGGRSAEVDDYPEVGAFFAETLVISCDPAS